MQARIQQLESLVVTLMQQSKSVTREDSAVPLQATYPTPEMDNRADEISSQSDHGSIKFNNFGNSSYVNSWVAVLDGIAELKDYFEYEGREPVQPAFGPTSSVVGPQLLLGCPYYTTREQVLASLPGKPEVDRLVSFYFNSLDMSPAILHSVEFVKEYEQFWERPADTPIIWVGLLYSIMCLAAQFQRFRFESGLHPIVSAEHDPQTMVEAFRANIVQCLILGNYHTGGPYVLETLILYFTCEHFSHKDAQLGIWLLLGLIVQLSMHMGFHRDPKHFGDQGISPFAGEMRRRVWATIMELDLGISAQMGLPRLIRPWQADTSEPRNYLDSDFNQQTRDLPPPRPDTENTPMLYRLSKARMMSTLGLILDGASDIREYTYTYSKILRIDTKLHETHNAIPTCLKWTSIAHCITDSPQVIMQRLFLELMFQKGKIILHRKFLSQRGDQYSDSHRACIHAALNILEYQRILDEETQPFCQLYQERWRVSSLVNHDFLLAASVLCSYLEQERKLNPDGLAENIEIIHDALTRSHGIWARSRFSAEAQKAAHVLKVVLRNRQDFPSNSCEAMSEASQFGMTPDDPLNYQSELGADLNLTFPFFPDREPCPEPILRSLESLPNFIPPDQFAMCDIYTTNN
ncbi:Transcription factor [Penicillium viridicatum]|nr:Transcription factor [Penicillium viridicatum]